MNIAVDAINICDRDGGVGAGIEHYTWSILFFLVRAAADHAFVLLVPAEFTEQRMRVFTDGVKNVTFLRSASTKIPFVTRHLWHPLRLALSRPDILFAPSGQVPLGWRGKSIVTIHDVLIYTHPEWFPQDQRQAFSTRISVPISIERATKIVTVSTATEEALHKLFPVTKNKTSVVHEGVSIPENISEEVSDRFPFDRDYILFLGTIEPRKNLVNAFRAFDAFLVGHPEQAKLARMIVAGRRGWDTKEIEQELVRVNHRWKDVEPNGVIQFLGPVTEEEKWNLLSRAVCLFFPSLDEGFGLPVIEAMSVGTPVITTKRGALKEVGGDAAIYVEPDDIESMSLSIAQCLLLPEGVNSLRQEGKLRAKKFTWEKASQDLLDVIESR